MALNLETLNYSLEKTLLKSGHLMSNISLEIKTLCFLNIIAKTEDCLSNIDFCNNDNVKKALISSAKDVKESDSKLSEILIDIYQYNLFHCGKALNKINNTLQILDHEELLNLFDFSTENYKFARRENWSTSKQLSDTFLECVDLKKATNVLDLCSGEGYLLGRCEAVNHNLQLTGYEIYPLASLVCRMRLYIHKTNHRIYKANVLQTKITDKYDIVFSDYPWGIRITDIPIEDDNMVVPYKKNSVKADWNFILKAVNATKETGKTVTTAPLGVLWSTTRIDTEIRKEIIDKGLLESIIIMPAGTYQSSAIAYCLMIFSRNNSKVKYIDASEAVIDSKSAFKGINVESIQELIHSENSDKIKFVSNEEIKNANYALDYRRYFNDISNIKLTNPKKIKDIGTVFNGYQYVSKNLTELEPGIGNVSILKITNIDEGSIDYDSMASANIDESKINKYLLQENDILLTSKGTVLKMAVVTDINVRKIIPHNNLLVIRITDKAVNPLYVCNYLNSTTGKIFLESVLTGSVIKNVNKSGLLELPVPILDEDTQEVIANRYLILKNNIKELKTKLSSAISKFNSIYDDEVGE